MAVEKSEEKKPGIAQYVKDNAVGLGSASIKNMINRSIDKASGGPTSGATLGLSLKQNLPKETKKP